jgi:hypothetical protein
MRKRVMDAVRGQFRPEFLNRVDEIVIFKNLVTEQLMEIVEKETAILAKRLAERKITIELTANAKALIAKEGFDPAYGARPLKRTIQRLVENPLARALLKGEFSPGDTIRIDADPVSGTLLFSTDRSTVVADGGARRDARTGSSDGASGSDREPAGAASGGRRRRGSVLDLPEVDRPKRDGDGGELVN